MRKLSRVSLMLAAAALVVAVVASAQFQRPVRRYLAAQHCQEQVHARPRPQEHHVHVRSRGAGVQGFREE